MRKRGFIGLMAVVVVFLWSMSGYAGCFLTVTAPNGGERLHLNDHYTIRWTNTCGKPVKLILRRNGRKVGVIARNLPASLSNYDWQAGTYEGGTAPAGNGYKILVKTVDNATRDASDGPFSLVSNTTTTQAPHLTSFSINNGAAETTNRNVTLNHTVTGGQPTHYRACESRNFQGSNCGWQTYTRTPTFQLSAGFGTRTVYFQVKNNAGQSNVKSDTIYLKVVLRPVLRAKPIAGPSTNAPQRKKFTVAFRDAYEFAKTQGFLFESHKDSPFAICVLGVPAGTDILEPTAVPGMLPPAGSKCDFILFGGRPLNRGWKFISYTKEIHCGDNHDGYRIDKEPQPNGESLKFKIHLWTEINGGVCWITLKKLVLEGPVNAQWLDAFRR